MKTTTLLAASLLSLPAFAEAAAAQAFIAEHGGRALAFDEIDRSTVHDLRNAAHGGLAVVYRRPDGNVGWIDPQRTTKGAAAQAVG